MKKRRSTRHVQVRPGGFLPHITQGFMLGPQTRINFSGRGEITAPPPEKPSDPFWVRLAEAPHPIIPYEREELTLISKNGTAL